MNKYLDALSCILLAYIMISIIPLFLGIAQSKYSWTGCYEPLSRIEYIFRSYRLGCYLGGVPNEH